MNEDDYGAEFVQFNKTPEQDESKSKAKTTAESPVKETGTVIDAPDDYGVEILTAA